jgi:Spy/CpxP family protein refolding chaperone
MKKGLIIGLFATLAMVLASAVFAAGPGDGYGNCPMAGKQVTPEQKQKFVKFQNEVLPLKQKMLQLRTELMNIRTQTPTDWNAVAAKQKEMVDVRIAIQKKAAEYGFKGKGFGHRGGHGPRGGNGGM